MASTWQKKGRVKMKKSWKTVRLLLVLVPIICIGVLGCGGGEPEIQKGDFDATVIDAQAEAEAKQAEAARRNVAGSAGEPTTSEGP